MISRKRHQSRAYRTGLEGCGEDVERNKVVLPLHWQLRLARTAHETAVYTICPSRVNSRMRVKGDRRSCMPKSMVRA